MGFRLGPKAESAGVRLVSFPEVGSTNAVAMERLQAGDRGPLWVVSSRQTCGKGRRGNSWATPEGNLAASLLLSVPTEPVTTATLGFVAGLALTDALAVVCGAPAGAAPGTPGEEPHGFRLKWPNDVLYGGAKVAGILLESRVGEGGAAVVIGIGVNVAAAPDGLSYPVAALADIDASVTAERLFEALAEAWTERYEMWASSPGFARMRETWLRRASGIGSEIAVSRGDDVVRGVFETVDEDGQLVLRTDDGRQERIAAGEVHFGSAATVRS